MDKREKKQEKNMKKSEKTMKQYEKQRTTMKNGENRETMNNRGLEAGWLDEQYK